MNQLTFTFNELPEAVSRLLEKMNCIEQLLRDLPQRSVIPEDKTPMSITQAAKLLQLSVQTVYQKINRHELPHYKVGNRLYFIKDDLIAYVLSGRRLTDAEADQEANAHLLALKQKRVNS